MSISEKYYNAKFAQMEILHSIIIGAIFSFVVTAVEMIFHMYMGSVDVETVVFYIACNLVMLCGVPYIWVRLPGIEFSIFILFVIMFKLVLCMVIGLVVTPIALLVRTIQVCRYKVLLKRDMAIHPEYY